MSSAAVALPGGMRRAPPLQAGGGAGAPRWRLRRSRGRGPGRACARQAKAATGCDEAGAQRDGAAVEFESNRSLAQHSTYGIGGPADMFATVRTVEELRRAYAQCMSRGARTLVLGRGSNVLFDDAGFRGCVIENRVDFCERLEGAASGDTADRVRYHVGAGVPFNTLGTKLSAKGLTGLEFACGIPGTLGGAIVMNAGANGQEVAAVVESVDVVMPDGGMRTLHADKGELPTGYRSTVFQRGGEYARCAVASATLRLARDTRARDTQLTYAAQRKASQPVTARSCGCIFRNPGGDAPSAGALIDQSGLKGARVGGAAVSDMHANFLVNAQGASAADVRGLIQRVKDVVREQHGHELREEVLYIKADEDES